MSTRWFNISESLDGGTDLGHLERENLDLSVTNISFVQGGWITVPSQSDMYDTPNDKLFDGQIFNILSTGEQFITKRFIEGINGWTDPFINSHSFALHTWNSSSHAVSASHLIGGSGGTGTGFPFAGSDIAPAVITGSLLLSGSGHITASGNISASGNITASNLHIDNNINLDGALSFDGFTFSDGNILVTSGSTVFGDSASQDTHTFTGSLYVSGGIYLGETGGNGGDIKIYGTASRAITSSFAISSSNVISSSYAISSSNVISSSYAISSSNVISSSYALSSSNTISSSFAISSSNTLSSSYAISSSNVVSSSYAISSSNVVSSSYALSSSFTQDAFSSSYAVSSSHVNSPGQIIAAEGQFGTETTFINDHITSSGNISASGESHILAGNLTLNKSVFAKEHFSVGVSRENFKSSSLLPLNNQTDTTYITASGTYTLLNAYKAFDGVEIANNRFSIGGGVNPNYLTEPNTSHSLDFDIGGLLYQTHSKYVVNTASFTQLQNAYTHRQFQISGSNVGGNDSNWVGIAEETLQDPSNGNREFKFNNDTGYRWYRLKIKNEGYTNAQNFFLHELKY